MEFIGPVEAMELPIGGGIDGENPLKRPRSVSIFRREPESPTSPSESFVSSCATSVTTLHDEEVDADADEKKPPRRVKQLAAKTIAYMAACKSERDAKRKAKKEARENELASDV